MKSKDNSLIVDKMSFVINTTIDKNQELLDAYKELYESEAQKDVYLINRNTFIAVDSFALALSSEFFKFVFVFLSNVVIIFKFSGICSWKTSEIQ